jgi:hypothetical protein
MSLCSKSLEIIVNLGGIGALGTGRLGEQAALALLSSPPIAVANCYLAALAEC